MASRAGAPTRTSTAACSAASAAAAPGLRESLEAAIACLRSEQLDDADRALAALLQRWPDQPDALHFLGVLRHAQGDSAAGIDLIRRAIVALPAEPGPWNNLGNVLVECGRLDEAIEAYRAGVAAGGRQPAAADALNNLATIHRRRDEWTEAEAACRRALELRPDFGDAWYNLSLALMGQGRVHDALLANSRAIALWPRHLQSRDQVIRALLLLGEREQAATLYREWLAEDPDNPVVRHQLAACLGEAAPERASDAYVEQVFDSFARSFDAKLEKLQYRAPALIAGALRRSLPEAARQLDIADVGCGTGLVGPLVRDWARRLAGCDLSVGMLRQARRRGVYDQLHKAELVHYLETQPAAFDVVVSADTLCYFGDLRPVARAAAQALRRGGCFIFTVEALADGDHAVAHRLQASGRYAHTRTHLEQAASAGGFVDCEIEPVVLRLEAGRDVGGWLARLVHARAPGGTTGPSGDREPGGEPS
jgi:predicted TPR repeat methyltransferase